MEEKCLAKSQRLSLQETCAKNHILELQGNHSESNRKQKMKKVFHFTVHLKSSEENKEERYWKNDRERKRERKRSEPPETATKESHLDKQITPSRSVVCLSFILSWVVMSCSFCQLKEKNIVLSWEGWCPGHSAKVFGVTLKSQHNVNYSIIQSRFDPESFMHWMKKESLHFLM